MTNLRVAALIGGVAVLAAWMSSAAGMVPSAPVTDRLIGAGSGPAQTATPAPARLDFDREVARLAARIENAPRPRHPARNPFRLSAPPRRTNPPPLAVEQTPPLAPAVGDTRTDRPPAVSLAGIGAEPTSDGLRRTAILAFAGRVFLARIGDEVMGRFEVRAVTDDAVELFDLRDGTPLRLTLP